MNFRFGVIKKNQILASMVVLMLVVAGYLNYTYDPTNNVFSLSGTIEQSTWNASTGPTLIGKYTCKKNTENGSCTELYLVESYINETSATTFSINNNAYYNSIGNTDFNYSSDSLAKVGYMYNQS